VSGPPEQPLHGRRILLTRRPEQSRALAERLAAAGAVVLQAPLLEIVPPEDTEPFDRALRALVTYDWLILTSGNAAVAVRSRMEALGLEPTLPEGLSVATVGPATTTAARSALGARRIDAAPAADFRAESLLGALAVHDLAGRRVLLPLSDRARDTLRRGLEERGAAVHAVTAYRTVALPDAQARLEALLRDGIDIVVLASPSAVESLKVALGGEGPPLPPVAALGPVTAAAARAAGLDVRVVAVATTADGVLGALERYFATGS
jgi:uroporphyrinogen-III synthase